MGPASEIPANPPGPNIGRRTRIFSGVTAKSTALTARAGLGVIVFMGVSAIPPRGVMPKYRVPYLSRGRNHVILHIDIFRQARTPDRHGEYACADRRPHRRGLCRRCAADS